MRTYYFKIRDKFISAVRLGKKRHEYRLATPERLQVKVGDNLVLISNQDKRVFVRTTVKSITKYNSWQDALNDNWQQDFKDSFLTLDEALKECYKFYSKDKVDTYGIISFQIEPLYVNYCNTNVLLDTNILIKRESFNNCSFEVSKLFNWFDNKSVKKYVHSLSKEELLTYRDQKARDAILTKLNSYDVLPSFSNWTDDFFNQVISSFSNDKNGEIDNALLKEVYNDNVGVLVTDDKLIIQKAEKLYIRDKVVTSAELLEKFETKFPENIEYKMLAVKLKKFEEVDLNDAFFNSLREDYEGQKFDRWFKKKGTEKAYVFEDNSGLKGFLYLKIELENEPDYLKITPILRPKKRLKVGTFKIERSGFRLGERFLKIIFDNARKSDVEEIYVTLFENKRDEVQYLKSLMEQWGFIKHGYKNENGELVLVKSMNEYKNTKDPKTNYPIVRDDAGKFILPIKAEYHTDLFPDKILKNEDMHLYEENLAHRYAIEKIYLSGAYNIIAKPGDLVLIYRMGDKLYKHYSSVVTGLAIIQEVIVTKTVDECINICKDRSIFEEKEIRKIYNKYNTVVKLLDFVAFDNVVPLSKLREIGVLDYQSGPRPFTKINDDKYYAIKKLGMES